MAHRADMLSRNVSMAQWLTELIFCRGNVSMAHRADLLSEECINGSPS